VARTAVIAGTASAVNGRVQRRQAERFATRDAQIVADRQEAYYQQAGQQPAADTLPPSAPAPSIVDQLKDLAGLKEQGILTEEEFAAQKAKILSL
jgi:hypothetical protein